MYSIEDEGEGEWKIIIFHKIIEELVNMDTTVYENNQKALKNVFDFNFKGRVRQEDDWETNNKLN